MIDDVRRRALDLYKGPFRFDGISYIWDDDTEMVADSTVIVRASGEDEAGPVAAIGDEEGPMPFGGHDGKGRA